MRKFVILLNNNLVIKCLKKIVSFQFKKGNFCILKITRFNPLQHFFRRSFSGSQVYAICVEISLKSVQYFENEIGADQQSYFPIYNVSQDQWFARLSRIINFQVQIYNFIRLQDNKKQINQKMTMDGRGPCKHVRFI